MNKCTENIPFEVAGALPNKETLALTVKRVRHSQTHDEDVTLTTKGEIFFYSTPEKK